MGTKKPKLPTKAGKTGVTFHYIGAKSGAHALDPITIPQIVKTMIYRGVLRALKTVDTSRKIGYTSLGLRKAQVLTQSHARGSTGRISQARANLWTSDASSESALAFGHAATTRPFPERPSTDLLASPRSGGPQTDEILQNYDHLLTTSITPFERESHLQWQRNLGREIDNPIDLFIQDEDENSALSEDAFEKVHLICPPVCLAAIRRKQGNVFELKSIKNRAWIDDRSLASPFGPAYRVHPNPVSARQMYRILQRRRAGEAWVPDADRRLM